MPVSFSVDKMVKDLTLQIKQEFLKKEAKKERRQQRQEMLEELEIQEREEEIENKQMRAEANHSARLRRSSEKNRIK